MAMRVNPLAAVLFTYAGFSGGRERTFCRPPLQAETYEHKTPASRIPLLRCFRSTLAVTFNAAPIRSYTGQLHARSLRPE